MKPGIYKNEALAILGYASFRLFTGLWCMADRQGRLKDEPGKIEAELFPFKFQRIKIDELMSGLESGSDPFISRYEVDGHRFIQIVNFSAHQNPHPREADSSIPPCKKKAMPRHVQGNAKAVSSRAGSSDVQDLLIPSSLIPELTPARVFDFDGIYDKYPNRDSRKQAEKHFQSSVKTEQDFLDIQKALANYIKHLQSEMWKQPQSAKTWFNNWKDWVNYKPASIGRSPAVPLPRPPADVSPDLSPAELEEIHRDKAEKLGRCAGACSVCDKTEATK